MDTAGSRDIEASRLAPLAAQRGEDREGTCKRDCVPSVGDQNTEVGHTIPAEVHKVMRKRRTEKWLESCENSLRY